MEENQTPEKNEKKKHPRDLALFTCKVQVLVQVQVKYKYSYSTSICRGRCFHECCPVGEGGVSWVSEWRLGRFG